MANYINEDSVILTEEDAEEFMNEYYLNEGYIVLEGRQAEEYLRRKKEAKEKSDEEIEADEDRSSRRGQYYLDRNRGHNLIITIKIVIIILNLKQLEK